MIRVGDRDEVVSVGAYRAAAYDPLLATNRLDGDALGSMAVAARSIFIRTDSYLYRLGM